MKVTIRTEMGGAFGYGHGRRMLGLAQALTHLGAHVTFVAARTPPERFAPFPAVLLADGLLQGRDRAEAWTVDDPEALVVDLKHDWEPALWPHLRERTRVVRVDHPYADPETCDLLVLPNCHQDPDVLRALSEAFEGRLLAGAAYALLDPDTLRWSLDHHEAEIAHRVVFTAGGSDPTNAMQRLFDMSAALPSRLPGVTWTFLLGQGQTCPLTVRGLHPHQRLLGWAPGLLAAADLWVGLFGVMPYQGMALGIPMVTVGHTRENAQASARLMAQTGATLDLGYLPTLAREDWVAALAALWEDPETRRTMGRLGRQQIDGQGARRVAEAILERFPDG